MIDNMNFAYVAAAGAILAAVLHLLGGKTLERYAVHRGILSAGRTIKFTALILVVLAVVCVLPDFAIYGMRGLAGYAILTAFIMHKFWDEQDNAVRIHETSHFLKNLVLAGLLIVATL